MLRVMRSLSTAPATAAARSLCRRFSSAVPFHYEPLFQSTGPLPHAMRKLTSDHVSTIDVGGKRVLQVEPEALRLLASTAMTDIAHLLRPGHLQQLANILNDPEASDNDRFVALELLKNANIAAGRYKAMQEHACVLDMLTRPMTPRRFVRQDPSRLSGYRDSDCNGKKGVTFHSITVP
eukprot:6207517-Pleurochrysis_carterae.AAC.4